MKKWRFISNNKKGMEMVQVAIQALFFNGFKWCGTGMARIN